MFTSFSKGVNQLHRTALNQAIHRMNTAVASEEHTMPVAILVGTKNIVLNNENEKAKENQSIEMIHSEKC